MPHPDVLDEIPGAYKDLDQVIKAQSDLVEVVAKLACRRVAWTRMMRAASHAAPSALPAAS